MSIRNTMIEHLDSSVENMSIAIQYEREVEKQRVEMMSKIKNHYAKNDDGSKHNVDEILNTLPSVNPEHQIFTRTIMKGLALASVLHAVEILGNVGLSSAMIMGATGGYMGLNWNNNEISDTEKKYAEKLKDAIYEKEIKRLSETDEFRGDEKKLREFFDKDIMLNKMLLSEEFVKSVEKEIGEFGTKFEIRKETVIENMKKIKGIFKQEEKSIPSMKI